MLINLFTRTLTFAKGIYGLVKSSQKYIYVYGTYFAMSMSSYDSGNQISLYTNSPKKYP